MGVREIYREFFRETPQAAQAVENAKEWADGTLALWEQKAFHALLGKIQKAADRPIAIGDAMTMAASIGRQNGIKEVLALINQDLALARRTADATGAGKES